MKAATPTANSYRLAALGAVSAASLRACLNVAISLTLDRALPSVNRVSISTSSRPPSGACTISLFSATGDTKSAVITRVSAATLECMFAAYGVPSALPHGQLTGLQLAQALMFMWLASLVSILSAVAVRVLGWMFSHVPAKSLRRALLAGLEQFKRPAMRAATETRIAISV